MTATDLTTAQRLLVAVFGLDAPNAPGEIELDEPDCD